MDGPPSRIACTQGSLHLYRCFAHTHIHTHTYAHTPTHTHTHTHTRAHTHTHTQTHTHTHTHKHASPSQSCLHCPFTLFRFSLLPYPSLKTLFHPQLLHTSPVTFLLFPSHLHLSFATYWKRLTSGVMQSFNVFLRDFDGIVGAVTYDHMMCSFQTPSPN